MLYTNQMQSQLLVNLLKDSTVVLKSKITIQDLGNIKIIFFPKYSQKKGVDFSPAKLNLQDYRGQNHMCQALAHIKTWTINQRKLSRRTKNNSQL
jgi:hypothetical protein